MDEASELDKGSYSWHHLCTSLKIKCKEQCLNEKVDAQCKEMNVGWNEIRNTKETRINSIERKLKLNA